MKNWPPGSHIVLETTCDEVPIIACGYKYNKRKVCCFIFAKGAGHTEPGRCYIAKWKDVHGNTMTRDIPRPQVISKYFSESNIIDIFNQGRQFDLCLEKHWVTDDGYFRLVTTLFGIIVTDCWKGYNFHLPVNHRHKGLELEDFARILARDLFENQFSSDRTSEDRAITILDDCYLPPKKIPSLVQTLSLSEADALTTLSSLSQSIVDKKTSDDNQHQLTVCTDEIQHEVKCNLTGKIRVGKRKRRGKCSECGNNTRFYCLSCEPQGNR